MADHIDTAFSQNVYNKTGKRQSSPGADDNTSATAALLRAATVLKTLPLERSIWLVHLTGDEFPADSLGSRTLISKMLQEKQDIKGLVLLDMIGYKSKKDNIFQINAGDSEESLKIAGIAMGAARIQTKYKAVFRNRFDPKNYLYNTSGLVFSDYGYPVILFNEHLNKLENQNRSGLHDMADTHKKIDWNYATAIAKIAIETTLRLASE